MAPSSIDRQASGRPSTWCAQIKSAQCLHRRPEIVENDNDSIRQGQRPPLWRIVPVRVRDHAHPGGVR
jgi:hypothetical protein